MIIGAVVEELIVVRDRLGDRLTRKQNEAICEACNLLDRLPNIEEATTYDPRNLYLTADERRRDEKKKL